jgi:hypothetical protein
LSCLVQCPQLQLRSVPSLQLTLRGQARSTDYPVHKISHKVCIHIILQKSVHAVQKSCIEADLFMLNLYPEGGHQPYEDHYGQKPGQLFVLGKLRPNGQLGSPAAADILPFGQKLPGTSSGESPLPFTFIFSRCYTYFIIQYSSRLSSRAGPDLAEW